MGQGLTVAALKEILFRVTKEEHDYYMKIASMTGHLHTQEEVKVQWQRYRAVNRVISQAHLLDEFHEWAEGVDKNERTF